MPLAPTHIDGATPLDAGEIAGLKPASILTHADLNSAEAANILRAMIWARRTRR